MFIQTEETPNPATMKFLPGREVLGQRTLDILSIKDAAQSPLAEKLFGIDGVRGVFLGHDFISVTKEDAKNWPALKAAILTAIMDHYASAAPMLAAGTEAQPVSTADEGDVVAKIREFLDQKVRPALAQDGGDVAFERFEDGIVYLTLKGACAGCPSATLTLKAGVESLLRHYIPEVREVRQVRT